MTNKAIFSDFSIFETKAHSVTTDHWHVEEEEEEEEEELGDPWDKESEPVASWQ